MLRGTIAHRAVLWPFTRPVVGTALEGYWNERSQLQIEANTAAEILEGTIRAAWQAGTAGAYRTAEALLNVNGPADWTAGLRSTTESMSDSDREIVFRSIRSLVGNGARVISDWLKRRGVRGEDITCAWSEVPLMSVTGYFERPNVLLERLRADLVGFRSNGDIDVVDLKFGAKNPQAWRADKDAAQIRAYLDAVQARVVDDGRRITGRIFYVDAGPWTARMKPWTERVL